MEAEAKYPHGVEADFEVRAGTRLGDASLLSAPAVPGGASAGALLFGDRRGPIPVRTKYGAILSLRLSSQLLGVRRPGS